MFCLMDVSGSMTEDMKDLAKRFYMLLYLFLKRRYKHVDVVFIRHTHEAQEVDEETFFYSRETGGTVVSTALEEMRQIVADRYPPADWNIYAAQASDGDNTSGDSQRTARAADRRDPAALPVLRLYRGRPRRRGRHARLPARADRSVARLRDAGREPARRWRCSKVRHRRDIFPVFRELFASGRPLAARAAHA